MCVCGHRFAWLATASKLSENDPIKSLLISDQIKYVIGVSAIEPLYDIDRTIQSLHSPYNDKFRINI